MKLLPARTGEKVRFEVPAEPGSEVFVAGTFNNWDPAAHPLQDPQGSGVYATALTVPPGVHEYKFVVNGVWTADPRCPDCTPNPFGSVNSVLRG